MTEISPDLPSLDFFQAPAISVEECRNLLNPEFSEILHSGLYSSTISYLGIPANHGLRAPPAIS
ncbi:MAG: hypothetical protein K0B15_07180 [Lentimicrobium sp.]|nr:hypothetical protein [Lentimicrobium sp.]